MGVAKPIIYNPQQESVEEFSKKYPVVRVVDAYEKELLKELFLIRNPQFRFNPNYGDAFEKFKSEHCAGKPLEQAGVWFYFPWSQTLTHFLPDDMHQELRTARNKYLITKEEQEKFYNCKVGIGGLSVGSHAALTIAMMGGAKMMRIADPDEISGSNLNRIRLDYTYVGTNKCEAVAQLIYQTNPYAEIEAHTEGISVDGLEKFMSGLDVFVECMDHPELKIRSRLIARKLGIPVVMATDNGDGIIFDIERYDLDPNLDLFNGVAGHLTLEEFQKFPPQELPKLATKIAGVNAVQARMLHSVSEVGKSLYSWPQLGDAATLAGVATAYVVKRLATGAPLKTGKLEVNLDSIFDPDYNKPDVVAQRDEERKGYLRRIGFEV
jgi:tRNA threonylcarbamoyladenosine dehydratase